MLDANILIRAVLGSRVLFLLHKYAGQVAFLTPDTAFQEARERLPEILERRKVPVAPAMAALDLVAALVQTVESETYAQFESFARQRIHHRDEDDWPILAARARVGMPYLDRRHGLLRLWRRDMDIRSGGTVPSFRRAGTTQLSRLLTIDPDAVDRPVPPAPDPNCAPR